ncbi:hypothetical protein [Pseudomonas sp. RIT-PI-S]|nr:hypothetical protein [Pseudomonas sp. RIT-PI-S]
MNEPPDEPGLLALAGEAVGMAGLIFALAYAVPLGFELLQL